MNKKNVKRYLNFLGVSKNYKSKKINCEICGNKKSKIITSKISWGKNKFGILPVCCCERCGFLFQNPRFGRNFTKNFILSIIEKNL